MTKPAVLIISGLDPQGCAGLSVDIQTMQHHGVHPIPLVSCLTEQTQHGLTSMGALTADQFMGQYHSCVAGFDIAAIKIGLLPNIEIARCVNHIVDNHAVPVVMDPVLAATSGGMGCDPELIVFIRDELLTKVTLLTPNLPELSLLTECLVDSSMRMADAVNQLMSDGLSSCLVTGGHADREWATDYFISKDVKFYLYQNKFQKQVRGTGCALASSIAAHLAFEHDSRDAVVLAKAYVTRGIRLADSVGVYDVVHHCNDALVLCDLPKLCYQPDLIGHLFNFPSNPDKLGIYPVVDSEQWVSKLILEGINTIQLRIKDTEKSRRITEVNLAVKHCKQRPDIAFFVNDYWQEAISAGAYGVHLGQEDLHDANLVAIEQAGLRLGVSTHSYWELARAIAINPSYIALGPIFETNSKQMPFSPQGVERLQRWVQLLSGHYPLVAIGGINLVRAQQLKITGVGSVAMISAIMQANDYQLAIRELLAAWQ